MATSANHSVESNAVPMLLYVYLICALTRKESVKWLILPVRMYVRARARVCTLTLKYIVL